MGDRSGHGNIEKGVRAKRPTERNGTASAAGDGAIPAGATRLSLVGECAPSSQRNHLHFGYLVFLGACLLMLPQSLPINTASIFFVPVTEEFGIARSTFSIHTTIISLSIFAMVTPMARLFRRCDLRVFMSCIMLLEAGCFLAYARATGVATFYVASFFIGAVQAVLVNLVVPVLVNNWFSSRTALLIGIGTCVQGLGAALFSAVGAQIIQAYGWRVCYVVFACVVLTIGLPTAVLLMRRDPAELGLEPIGFAESGRHHMHRHATADARRHAATDAAQRPEGDINAAAGLATASGRGDVVPAGACQVVAGFSAARQVADAPATPSPAVTPPGIEAREANDEKGAAANAARYTVGPIVATIEAEGASGRGDVVPAGARQEATGFSAARQVADAPATPGPAVTPPGVEAREAFRRPTFWVLVLESFCISAAIIFNYYISPYVVSLGTDIATAGLASSAVMVGMCVGKVVIGAVGDRSAAGSVVLGCGAGVVGCVGLAAMHGPVMPVICGFAFCFGMAYASASLLGANLTRYGYGPRGYDRIWPRVAMFIALGNASGSYVWGLVTEAFGFTTGLLADGALIAVALVLGLVYVRTVQPLRGTWACRDERKARS